MINNAGITGRPGPADWQTLDDYKKVLGINTFGMIDVTHTFLPLIKKEKGRIVNTGKLIYYTLEIFFSNVSVPVGANYSTFALICPP